MHQNPRCRGIRNDKNLYALPCKRCKPTWFSTNSKPSYYRGEYCKHASPAADTVPPLMASGAKIRLKDSHGERELILDDFMKGPGQTDIRDSEVLIEIDIPKLGPSCRNHFLKVGRRRAMAISVVNLAGWMKKNCNGVIDDARIVLGAVAPTALRAKNAEAFLRGKPSTEEVLREAARVATSECRPINDIRATERGRRLLVESWTYRLLQILSGTEGG